MTLRCFSSTIAGLVTLAASGCGGDRIAPPDAEPPVIVTLAMPTATLGEAYEHALTAIEGQTPYTWQVSGGDLPGGLVLMPQGLVSGTPVATGRWDFSVKVTGADGLWSQAALGITVEESGQPRIETAALPDGLLGVDYRFELRANGGSGTYTWEIVEGGLPPGMTLVDGIVSGSPTAAGVSHLLLEVTSGSLSDRAELTVKIYPSEPLRDHMTNLRTRIEAFISTNEELLARSPHLASELTAKIEMLSEPGLDERILADERYVERVITSIDERTLPVTLLFPADSMRAGALLDAERIPLAMQRLEEFLGLAWPWPTVREWYGFAIGHGGGGGTLQMEDRGTYANRGVVSHDAILPHELGHTWIGHEGLTQFLGNTYTHQVLETGSTDPGDWILPGYTPFDPGNTGLFALIDIYTLIGVDGMGSAYRAIYQAGGAPYGSPLSQEDLATFVDAAPSSARAQVGVLVTRIDG